MSSEESGEESGSEDGGSRVRILNKRKLTFRSDKVDEFFARLDTLIKDDKSHQLFTLSYLYQEEVQVYLCVLHQIIIHSPWAINS